MCSSDLSDFGGRYYDNLYYWYTNYNLIRSANAVIGVIDPATEDNERLVPVIPPVEEFPYALRLVSEVLSSNGSTSQGSICGSTLALMDAGVPIKEPVAGISCGLITEGERWMTMVDIQGLEDFFGDMDFKVAGTSPYCAAQPMKFLQYLNPHARA